MALTTSPQSPSTGPVATTARRSLVDLLAVRALLERGAEALRPAPVHVLTTTQLVAGLGSCVGVTALVTAVLGLVLR